LLLKQPLPAPQHTRQGSKQLQKSDRDPIGSWASPPRKPAGQMSTTSPDLWFQGQRGAGSSRMCVFSLFVRKEVISRVLQII
jgi:hypothetical protein